MLNIRMSRSRWRVQQVSTRACEHARDGQRQIGRGKGGGSCERGRMCDVTPIYILTAFNKDV